MSNLKKRLNKTAGGKEVGFVKDKLYAIMEELISQKAKEIGWKDGNEGVIELVEMYMQEDNQMGIQEIASIMVAAVDTWGQLTEENYPNGTE